MENKGIKIVANNRKARFNYSIEDRFEAGMVLKGTEVKSLREGRANLKDCYCRFTKHELFVVGLHIAPYSHGTHFNHKPERPRKLLLHKRELFRLNSKVAEKAGALLGPAENYGGKKSFRFLAPFAIIIAVIFGTLYFQDRRRGGYQVEKI